VRLLLDTHALLWWMEDSTRLPPGARAAIRAGDNRVYVSAGTAWEIAIKFHAGKLPSAQLLVEDFDGYLSRCGFQTQQILISHAIAAAALQFENKDPFDRMLIAQAQIEGLTLVSNQAAFDRFGIQRIW